MPELATYDSAEHAFFSMMTRNKARADGAMRPTEYSGPERAGNGIDVQKVIETLYRERKLTMDHILVLRHYGVRNLPPDERREKEARAAILWREALDAIGERLKQKGLLK